MVEKRDGYSWQLYDVAIDICSSCTRDGSMWSFSNSMSVSTVYVSLRSRAMRSSSWRNVTGSAPNREPLWAVKIGCPAWPGSLSRYGPLCIER